jgi:hypothetical protein
MKNVACLHRFILALGLPLFASACGGSGTDVSSASSSGSGGSRSTAASSTASATGSGGEGGQSTASATSSTGSSSSTGAGGSASGGVTPTLASMQFFVNCQPIVGPDPINGSFTAKYESSAGAPASATITSAKLTLESAPNTLVWPFTVTPAGGGPVQPGDSIMVAHTKQNNPNGGEGQSPCNFCSGTWTLSVTWDLGGGKTASDTLPAEMVGCAF